MEADGGKVFEYVAVAAGKRETQGSEERRGR